MTTEKILRRFIEEVRLRNDKYYMDYMVPLIKEAEDALNRIYPTNESIRWLAAQIKDDYERRK